MGFGFRKSINLLGSFLRLTFSKSGMGLSAGVKGLRVGIGPTGKRVNASLPGTGVYYRKTEGWDKSSPAASQQAVCPKCGISIGKPGNPNQRRASFLKHLMGGKKYGGHELSREEAENIVQSIIPKQ